MHIFDSRQPRVSSREYKQACECESERFPFMHEVITKGVSKSFIPARGHFPQYPCSRNNAVIFLNLQRPRFRIYPLPTCAQLSRSEVIYE